MIPRRISTIIAWIRTLGIINQTGDMFTLASTIIPSIPVIALNDIEQPILPATGNLQEYDMVKRRMSNAKEIITIYKNQVKVERANFSHIQLVNLVAERIRQSGGIPKSN